MQFLILWIKCLLWANVHSPYQNLRFCYLPYFCVSINDRATNYLLLEIGWANFELFIPQVILRDYWAAKDIEPNYDDIPF